MPSLRWFAPIARMIERALYSSSPTQTRWGSLPSFDSSTRVASSETKRVPKRSAWSRKCCIISGPMIPSGKPG